LRDLPDRRRTPAQPSACSLAPVSSILSGSGARSHLARDPWFRAWADV